MQGRDGAAVAARKQYRDKPVLVTMKVLDAADLLVSEAVSDEDDG